MLDQGNGATCTSSDRLLARGLGGDFVLRRRGPTRAQCEDQCRGKSARDLIAAAFPIGDIASVAVAAMVRPSLGKAIGHTSYERRKPAVVRKLPRFVDKPSRTASFERPQSIASEPQCPANTLMTMALSVPARPALRGSPIA